MFHRQGFLQRVSQQSERGCEKDENRHVEWSGCLQKADPVSQLIDIKHMQLRASDDA
jgi:hypothetical protein